MTVLKLYTDGGCSGNQMEKNYGGWGCVLEFGDVKKELYGSAIDTTNNKMELTAVIEGFKALKRDGLTIDVFSDSSYVMNCFREKWYINWEKNNWISSSKKPVENQDLWKTLLELVRKHNVTFHRVKGHVNLNSKVTDFDKLYEKFREWNGSHFTFDDFKYITEMNNLADALANRGIDEAKAAISREGE